MIELARGPRLLDKHPDEVLVGNQLLGEYLQRYGPVERNLDGLVYRAHAAPADALFDQVSPDVLPGQSADGIRRAFLKKTDKRVPGLDTVADFNFFALRNALAVQERAVRAALVFDDKRGPVVVHAEVLARGHGIADAEVRALLAADKNLLNP